MSRIVIFSLIACLPLQLSATEPDEPLVKLEGKILDAATMEPIDAKVVFNRLPAASVTGIRMFNDEEGDYHLLLQKHNAYRIEVSAEEYQAMEVVINTDGEEVIDNDFLLYRIPQKGETFSFSDKIFFEQNRHIITDETLPVIQMLGEIMKDHPDMRIRLEGHTDKGRRKSLYRLSEERVEEVKAYLVDVMGISKKRIKTKGYGGSRPLSHENTPEGRRLNRRVEVRVLSR
jgi:outer membrane protein OmpA-like peptidoglycan-associated protein